MPDPGVVTGVGSGLKAEGVAACGGDPAGGSAPRTPRDIFSQKKQTRVATLSPK